MVQNDYFVLLVNEMIEEAILHGGDMGGPYESNEKNLVEAMTKFQRWYGLKDYIIVRTRVGFAFAKTVKTEGE